jgi:hypothetical protein
MRWRLSPRSSRTVAGRPAPPSVTACTVPTESTVLTTPTTAIDSTATSWKDTPNSNGVGTATTGRSPTPDGSSMPSGMDTR